MNCARARRLISRYADSELGPDAARELEKHLAVCSGCRAEEAELRRTLALLELWPGAEPRLGFEAVLSRTSTARSAWIAVLDRLPIRGWAMAALALAAISGGSVLGVRSHQQTVAEPPSHERVVAAMDLHSFNDLIEASLAEGFASVKGDAQ